MEQGRSSPFESINVCYVCDRAQSNGDTPLLLCSLKAEGFLTKKPSFAVAFSSFHPENVSHVTMTTEQRAEFYATSVDVKEHIVTFLFTSFDIIVCVSTSTAVAFSFWLFLLQLPLSVALFEIGFI